MVNINFFTFNMGGTNGENWSEILKTEEWKLLLSNDGIWVICTQEDQRNSPFMAAMTKHFESTHESVVKSSHLIRLPNFQVKLGVFTPKGLLPKALPDRKFFHKCPFPAIIKALYHKSSILINWKNISFVGSHLPFNPDDEDDVSLRENAVTSVINSWLKKNKDQSMCFILGDLNFRKNQLREYIDKNKYYISDLTDGLPPTCKMVSRRRPDCGKNELEKVTKTIGTHVEVDNSHIITQGNDTIEVSDQTISPANSATESELQVDQTLQDEKTLQDFEKLVINDCYVTSANYKVRNPSLCDRVLLLTRDYKGSQGISYTPQIVSYPPITQSDHNAVFVRVEVPYGLITGGSKKKISIILRKTKKLYVVHTDKKTKLKHIMMNKQRVYLKDIRGQYVYKKE